MHEKTVSALRLYCTCLAFVFLLMALARAAFWVVVSPELPDPFSRDCLKALYIGLRFDARIAALFTLPLGLALSVPFLARRLCRYARVVTIAYAPFVVLLVLVYVADFGFYAYLGNRVSALLFELLADFRVAVEMVVQSYPVGLITLAVTAVTGAVLVALHRIVRMPVQQGQGRRKRAAGFACGFLLFALAVYGQLNASLFPLRWSNAFFTPNEVITALALNPVQSLYDTYGVSSEGYSLEQARAAYPLMADFLLVDKGDGELLDYERHKAAAPRPDGRPPLNVVVVFMESLSYPKTSFAPGAENITPHLRELAAQSLLFHRFFANSRTTARAVFSTVTGIPDINRGSTASRNPLVVDQRVIANEFDGYDKFYMIGGNTSWANIRAALAQNIENLAILEEGYWKAPRVDVWGISDFDLFRETHELLAARNPDKPFLAVIQTASFHKPYTVPDTPGFAPTPMPEEQLKRYGFDSQEEYYSLHYTDFALGEFMRLAKNADYYNNTVFFIFGDHGLKDANAVMPGGYAAANLAPWHVPLLIHAAPELGLFTPGESYAPVSQVDIFPTAAALAGISHSNWTLGRDIFDARHDDSRLAFIGGKDDTPIRVVAGDYCYYDNRAGKKALFRLEDAEAVDHAGDQPDLFERLDGMAGAIDATARYMLFNNKKNSRGG